LGTRCVCALLVIATIPANGSEASQYPLSPENNISEFFTFFIYFGVTFFMARLAKPNDIKRFVIVFMMGQ
jgi:hypothetical protein